MNKRRVVYTVIIGNYDLLREVREVDPSVDYICITDNTELTSKTWKLVAVDQNFSALRSDMKNRLYKMFPNRFFPDYEESLYVDGNIEIMASVSSLFDTYLAEGDIAIPRHPLRTCLYDEAEACRAGGKGNAETILDQVKFYREQGFPEKAGLFENNVLLRRHNRTFVTALMEAWWQQFQLFSQRDQISLQYCVWKLGGSIVPLLEGPRETSKYLRLRLHCKEMALPLVKRLYLEYGLLGPRSNWVRKMVRTSLGRFNSREGRT